MEEPVQVMRGGRRRSARIMAAVAMLTVVALAVAGGPYLAARVADRPPAPEPTVTASPTPDPSREVDAAARAFLRAWEREDWERLQALTIDQSLDAAGVHERAHATLQLRSVRFFPYAPEVDGDTATVPYTGTWDLGELGRHRYRGAIRLARDDVETAGQWRVRWWYSTVHPDLTPETHLQRTRVFPARAAILDRHGEPLATSREVVVVGLQPGRVSDVDRVVNVLSETTNAQAKDLRKLLSRDDLDPDGFYRVTGLRPSSYEALRPRLFPLDGVVFRRRQPRRLHQRRVGESLIGEVGTATAEDLERLGGTYRPGDRVGTAGLEQALETQLAGEPAYEAAIVDDLGLVRSLGFKAGVSPQSVHTSLDIPMQRAAEHALAAAPSPAALVAIDSRSGEVRAAASTPRREFNRALSGVYPPGSSFKIVTSAAALSDGRTPRSVVACPRVVRIGEPPIRNAGGASYGRVPLRVAFLRSCNTTYARLGVRVGADEMTRAATLFGFNRDLDFTLPAAGGSFPRPDGDPDLARASIGQARIQVSPLHMASVAATVASGAYREPTLLTTDEPEPAGVLRPRLRAQLEGMMLAVVRTGTGTAARMPHIPVAGKTGSAQFAGGGDQTHAWFVGFRGHLAFAVLVERGGGGGAVAAPVARDFLSRIGSAAVRPDAQ